MQNSDQMTAGNTHPTLLFYLLQWGVSSRWSFEPNSVCGSIETTTTGKTHPTLYKALVDFLKLGLHFRLIQNIIKIFGSNLGVRAKDRGMFVQNGKTRYDVSEYLVP